MIAEGMRAAPRQALWWAVGSAVGKLARNAAPYARFVLSPSLTDVRPFTWAGYSAAPRYTYIIDLPESSAGLSGSLQKETRKWIRKAEQRFTFREGDAADALRIRAAVDSRLRAQGRRLRIGEAYVSRLFNSLPAGSIRSFVVEENGQLVTGVIVVVEDRVVRLWQGGSRPSAGAEGATEFLHWRASLWTIDAGKREIELFGANTPSITRFKVKFNPVLRGYFVVESSSPLLSLARSVYLAPSRRTEGSTGEGRRDTDG